MKRSVKRISIVLIGLILGGAAAALIYVWPMLSMSPFPTSIVPGTDVISIQNSINSIYFIPVEDYSYIAVDAGSNKVEIKKVMEEQGIEPASVTYVLLTHTDSDHIAALSLFTNAEIIINEDEEQMIDGTIKRNVFQKNKLPDDVKKRLKYVAEGELLSLSGAAVTCLAAPGHTPGSMAYFVEDRYLFTGDAIAINNNKADVHPFTMDKLTASNSIDKLLDIDDGNILVFTAHYGVYRISDFDK